MPRRSRPLKLSDFLKRLKTYGVVALGNRRGKGSEIILLLPTEEGGHQGPQYPIKNHGAGTEISVAVIKAALRRFGIDEAAFWD